jgi:hypothetical protein
LKKHVHQYDLLQEMIRGRDERLKIQATEYERRLEGLNHENERIIEILKQSIPREVFDREINGIKDRTSKLEVASIKQEGRHQLVQYIPWILTALSLILMYLTYKK